VSEQKRGTAGKIVRSVALNMIPGYPIVMAFTSAKKAIGSGATTLRNFAGGLEKQEPDRHLVRTWREAIESRPPDAAPLETIARVCLIKKRLSMTVAFLSLGYLTGGVLGANYVAIFNGLLGMALPMLFVVREEHRLWQMDVGPKQPDVPLPGYREFFRAPGVCRRLLDARLF
jgi:hypothetical protein